MQRRKKVRQLDIICPVVLVLLVGAHFWFPKFGDGTGRDTYSYTNEGKRAFYEITQAVTPHPGEVSRNTDPIARITESQYWDSNTVICLLGPARYPNVAEWDRLLKWVERGGSLLIAANDQKPEFAIEQLGIQVKRMEPIETEGEQIQSNLMRRGRILWQSNARIVKHRGDAIVTTQGTTQAIRKRHGNGNVVVVASDFIFSNQSQKFVPDNRILAMALLDKAAETGAPAENREVIFDEALNISGTPKIVGVLLNPLFKPITVQMLIGIVLFVWWRSHRFGPLLPASSTARQNIVDHTDAVGTFLFKTGDGSAALRAYLRQLFAELKMKMHRGREERVIEPLAYKLGKDPELIKRLLQRAVKASKQPELDRRQAAHLLRQLSVIRRAARQSAKSHTREKQANAPAASA